MIMKTVINILCVWTGFKYSDEYVIRLHRSIKRNLTRPFKFTVITDRTQLPNEMNLIPIEVWSSIQEHNGWWYKMQAFKPENMSDINLLLDLDLVIINNIDHLIDMIEDKLMICQDFNRHLLPDYQRCNSSVVGYTREIGVDIWNKFLPSMEASISDLRGDQDWFDVHYTHKKWWPYESIMSWKWEVAGKSLDPRTDILVFHGKPDPHEVRDQVVIDNW